MPESTNKKHKKHSSLISWLATGTPTAFRGYSCYTEQLGLDHGRNAYTHTQADFGHNNSRRTKKRGLHHHSQSDHDSHHSHRSTHSSHHNHGNNYGSHHSHRSSYDGHRSHRDGNARPHEAQGPPGPYSRDTQGYGTGSPDPMHDSNRCSDPDYGINHVTGRPSGRQHCQTSSAHQNGLDRRNQEAGTGPGDQSQYQRVGPSTNPMSQNSGIAGQGMH